MNRTHVIMRKNTNNMQVGNVADCIDYGIFLGKEVETVGQMFVRVNILNIPLSDYDEFNQLESDLKERIKTLRTPDLNDNFYQELLTKGFISVDYQTYKNYAVVNNA